MGLLRFEDAEDTYKDFSLVVEQFVTFNCYALHPRWLHLGYLVELDRNKCGQVPWRVLLSSLLFFLADKQFCVGLTNNKGLI